MPGTDPGWRSLHQPVKDLRPACRPGHQDDRVRRGAGGLQPGSTAATRLQGDLHQCGDHLRRSGAQRSWSQPPLTRPTRSTVIRSPSTMYTTGKDQPSAGDSPRGGTLQPDTGQQPGPLSPPRSPACRLGRPGSGELSLSPRATIRSSRAAAEQLGHRLLMRDSAGPASGHPRLVRRERGLDFDLDRSCGGLLVARSSATWAYGLTWGNTGERVWQWLMVLDGRVARGDLTPGLPQNGA